MLMVCDGLISPKESAATAPSVPNALIHLRRHQIHELRTIDASRSGTGTAVKSFHRGEQLPNPASVLSGVYLHFYHFIPQDLDLFFRKARGLDSPSEFEAWETLAGPRYSSAGGDA